MKRYQVTNPYLVFSIGSGKERREYSLKRGDVAELPETDIAVRAMLARRQLSSACSSASRSLICASRFCSVLVLSMRKNVGSELTL